MWEAIGVFFICMIVFFVMVAIGFFLGFKAGYEEGRIDGREKAEKQKSIFILENKEVPK